MLIYSIKRRLELLLSLPVTIYFNFHYLPFKIALRLPIVLYNPRFYALRGECRIISNDIRFGMIRLGLFNTPICGKAPFLWMNEGGNVIFYGSCVLGSGSVIKVGKRGSLIIEDGVNNATSLRIDCNHLIRLGEKSRFGWDVYIMDSNQHRIKKTNGGGNSGYAPVEIGKKTWITSKCVVLPGSRTADGSVFASGSLLCKDYRETGSGLYTGCPARFHSNDYFWDVKDDKIVY